MSFDNERELRKAKMQTSNWIAAEAVMNGVQWECRHAIDVVLKRLGAQR